MRYRIRHCAILFFVAFLTLASASTEQNKPSDQETVLRTTTRLVTISAVVKDRSGKPVTDLTRDDFVLLEESKPQVIDFFALESNRKVVRSGNPVLPANAYTNRPADQASVSPNVCLILLDSLNTQIAEERIEAWCEPSRSGECVL